LPEWRLNAALEDALAREGFKGRMEEKLPQRLGRPIDPQLADLGRLIFFDEINGLHNDNSCAGCHAPAAGFGDTQSIAIGVQNNRIVGPDRAGPRNQRRAPAVVNTAFIPKLMWNGRFIANSGDPFDNSQGFHFPLPEGDTRFPANDPNVKTLLAAQGHIPQTELVEMAGFSGTSGTIGADFDQFDDSAGDLVPPDTDGDGFRNEEIRTAVLARFNSSPEYLNLFGQIFNNGSPLPSGGITFDMIGRALAEFQMSLTFMNAPIDRFARGSREAMSVQQKRGALLFFGKAGCIDCHAAGPAENEMFSDFENRVIGIPQIGPVFGVAKGNVIFDGPGKNEDFGAEQISGDSTDRYKFRSSPLRNAAVQPTFMHNGAFTKLEDAVFHHLNVYASSLLYDPRRAGVDNDLWNRQGPILPVLRRLDPLIVRPTPLNKREFDDLVEFVREGLLDERAKPENLCKMVPVTVPSGRPVANFQGCNP
jgi:cytochrome c peroxidase